MPASPPVSSPSNAPVREEGSKPSLGLLNGGTITAEQIAKLFANLTGREVTDQEMIELRERFPEQPIAGEDPETAGEQPDAFAARLQEEFESADEIAAKPDDEADDADGAEAEPSDDAEAPVQEDDDQDAEDDDEDDDSEDANGKPKPKPRVPPKSLHERMLEDLRTKYDPDQPRDEAGRWTDGSGGGEAQGSQPLDSPGQGYLFEDADRINADARDPLKMRDQKEMPIEQRAQVAIKRAAAHAEAMIGNGETVQVGPASWEEVDSDEQSEHRSSWIDENISEYEEPLYEQWSESLETDMRDEVQSDDDFKKDVWLNWADAQGYSRESAEEAWLNSSTYREGELDLSHVDESLLKWSDETQTNPPDEYFRESVDDLTTESREAIDAEVERRIESAKEDGPPDHISQQAHEDAAEAWDGMDDDEKFKYAGIDKEEVELEAPESWEVLDKDASAEDYAKVSAIVRGIQEKITEQEFEHRGLQGEKLSSDKVAEEIWSAWKGSSTSEMGLLLQHATAEELGGLRQQWTPEQQSKINSGALGLSHATGARAPDGVDAAQWHTERGIEIAKAHVHGTWAASQYAMKQAGIESLPVYRGLMLEKSEVMSGKIETVGGSTGAYSGPEYQKLSDIKLLRNGAASTTTDMTVANGWGGVGTDHLKEPTRVVLRINVPREAVLSLPVFGQNIHTEQEVVVAGHNKWLGWDAWLGRAPGDGVPIKRLTLLELKTVELLSGVSV